MVAAYASYEFEINWDGTGTITADDFESGTSSWTGAGVSIPTLASSTTQFLSGSHSLSITWAADATSSANRTYSGLTSTHTYTASVWVFVPSSGGRAVQLVAGANTTAFTTATNLWTKLEVTFVASATTQLVQIKPSGTPTAGDKTYADYAYVLGAYEDVTNRVLARDSISIDYGRDNSRALSPVTTGEANITLDNRDLLLSPENTSSPIYGLIEPGREVDFRTVFGGTVRGLYRGFLDDMKIDPAVDQQSVTLSMIDAIGHLGTTIISTPVYVDQRVGTLIGVVLDAMGWAPSKRDLDTGASKICYWWEEGTDAMTAIIKLVNSEGGAAFYTVDTSGNFVFRDRNHRYIKSASITSNATFRSIDAPGAVEPMYSDIDINLGWKDVINSVSIPVTQYTKKRAFDFDIAVGNTYVPGVIWSTTNSYSIKTGQSVVITAKFETLPAIDVLVPANRPSTGLDDFVVASGAVTVAIDRTSGMTINITVTATSRAVVNGMKLRGAVLVTPENTDDTNGTVTAVYKDQASITKYGREITSGEIEAPWASVEDATAIAATIVNQRSNRLPVVDIKLNNDNSTRLTQMLSRNLSDRITVVEPDTHISRDFFIEHIRHDIQKGGMFHETTFGCEQTATGSSLTNPFRFDTAGSGFDQGFFAF